MMNIKILEIAGQAGLHGVNHDSNFDSEDISADRLEKFAQLIVAECALLCISRPGPGDDVRTREHCAEQIKEHFGMIDEIE